MKSLPKTIYVKLEDPDSTDEWLNASDDAADHAVPNEKVVVGIYELKLRTVVTANVEIA